MKSDARACEAAESCREKLLKVANVRGITLLDDSENIIPTKLADLLFDKIIEE